MHKFAILFSLSFSAVAFIFAAVIATNEIGCAGGSSVPPNVVNVGIDVGTCVLDVVSKDLVAGMNLGQALIDAAVRCYGSASPQNVAAAQRLWDAHKAAEARETDGGK